jgi:hypothetical protein
MTTNSSVPGLMMPTQKAMISGNPRDSAITSMNNNAQSQANANKALAGGKRRKSRSYQGGAINAPQMQMLYAPQGGVGTNPNDQIKANSQTSTQMAANSVYDKQATQTSVPLKGGSSKRRKGGNPNWLWGCMSGGKKYTKKTHKKNKKSKKHRKHRK